MAAQDTGQGLVLTLSPDVKYDSRAKYPASFDLDARLFYGSPHFDFVGELSGHNDGKYGAELIDLGNGKFGTIYAFIDEAGIVLHGKGLSLSAGRFRSHDEVDSPYSLFINSTGLSAMSGDLRYGDGILFVESRWIGLENASSATTPAWTAMQAQGGTGYFPDRGANYKVFGMRFGELSLGYQDSIVYQGRYFDAEYFALPLPSYFIQYVRNTGGRPWQSYSGSNFNDNTMMGGFASWKRPGVAEANLQILIDDGGILGDTNPNKIALEAGGRLETDMGSFGLYTAMATKYTFEPSIGNEADGNTYYPDVSYENDWNTTKASYQDFALEDNSIGYKYGENNLALQADWRGSLVGFGLRALGEFRLAGSNSPANAWGDLTSRPVGTKWLDDAVLEKRVLAQIDASRPFGDIILTLSVMGGVAFDALVLRGPLGTGTYASIQVLDSMVKIWAPVAGNTQLFGRIVFGGTYRVGKGQG